MAGLLPARARILHRRSWQHDETLRGLVPALTPPVSRLSIRAMTTTPGVVTVGAAVFAIGASTTLPMPLYTDYAAMDGGGASGLAAAFVAYAATLILTVAVQMGVTVADSLLIVAVASLQSAWLGWKLHLACD